MIHIEVHETKLGSTPKFNIRLPAIPNKGDSLTLPDDHYVVDEVYWQANVPDDPGKGYQWPEHVYYTIRLVAHRKFPT